MKLGANFPWQILYARQNTVGLGLISPKTAIAMLAIKLHMGNIRANARIIQIIKAYEENMIVEYREGLCTYEKNDRQTINQIIWVEEIY